MSDETYQSDTQQHATLRDRIADIDEKHYQIIANDTGWACACGIQMNAGVGYRGWRLHKADSVIAAVKLKRVNRYGFHRWVTEWEADDES